MGMRIQGSESTSSAQSASVASWQQRQQSFKDLFSSLQSGDLSAAQNAVQGLTGGTGKVAANSPLAPIVQALQTGDIAAAQKAAQQFQANRTSHHHRHQESSSVSAANVSTPKASASGVGALINLTA